MVEIVENSKAGAIDRLHNLEGLGDAIEIDGGILEAIDGFDDTLNICSAKEFGSTFEGFDGCGVLTFVLIRRAGVRSPGCNSLP
jgi:hypothetical protein